MLNQVFLNHQDPLLGGSDVNEQLQRLKLYESQLMRMQNANNSAIWDSIDKEMTGLSESQKQRFFEDSEYRNITESLQQMVQIELLSLVKGKIEMKQEGKDLLQKQLSVVKRLKTKIVQDTDNEIAIFNKFREFSKEDPGLTYEEFCKKWHNM